MSTYNDYTYARNLLNQGDFRRCYDTLNNYTDKDSEWYYLRGVSAMNLGFYEEGEDYIKRAKFMEPSNQEYQNAYDKYINYRNNYNNRAQYYNNRRSNGLDNPGCCCCGSNCCDTCCTLWCCDCLCESMGGDLISCC
ncbi:tetratricopeptide repeat protein [Peptostreptococcus faecalis]|uniref:tetratricopeptide repeat protein n=1 Tax=Peptostreptococcus faecalis TaxID=2045015 RepID=UPI000C7AC42E|nr:CDC27 family protein [Peptostreptococcus faecalis]